MAKASLEMQASSRATVKAKTKTTLAPMALQGLEILSLPVSSLPDYISKAAEANPLLEVNYDDSYEDMLEQTERADNQELSELRRKHAEGRLPGLVGDWDFSRIQDDCIETETLREYLHLQASCLGLPHDAAALVEAIIEGISDDGYYTGDVGVVSNSPMSIERLRSCRACSLRAWGLGRFRSVWSSRSTRATLTGMR